MAKTIVNDSPKAINQEMQTIITLASSMAHEFKNCLAAISINAEIIGIKEREIRKRAADANYLIDNSQLQIKGVVVGKPETEDFKQYSIVKNIEEVLDQYPFKEGERELIKLDIGLNDFEYVGNPMLTNHVLYNLIKNALRAIANADKGEITIRLESDTKFNNLIFRDTATGISKEFLPKMFKLFASQSTAQGGTGIGLAFCKLIKQ